ncbi:MAG: sigma-70 family RNA polymerase sigma factor [Planctomycetota bacterium]
MDSSDTLITAARQRDRRAIEELLVRHLPPLEAFVRLRMGPALRARLTAPDLVQSVCREVLEDLGDFQFRGEAAFRHWLYTRAQNKLLEKRRYVDADKRSPAREESPGEGSAFLSCYHTLVTPSRVMAAREDIARIEAAFDALPDDYREAITLHRICGLGHAEIAERMGRSEGAVRNLVYRGMSRLALQVEEMETRDPPPSLAD